MRELTSKARVAFKIGTLCSVAYFAVYIARNILSAVTPIMVKAGYTEEYIGEISSLFLVLYAIGQLINGMIGDRIRANYMIGLGLTLAGVTTFAFPYLVNAPLGATVVYGLTGFFLSMIYGPMTKVVAESTEPPYTTRCSLGYTVASFLGSPAAGLFAILLSWQGVFYISSAVLVLMGACVFLFFALFERTGIVKYGERTEGKEEKGSIGILFSRGIVRFSFISILTGVIRTSVVFWLPTYIAQYLGFGEERSIGIFSVATIVITATSFITVFVYEKVFHSDMDKTILLMFCASALFFLLTFLFPTPALNIVFIILAIMGSGGAATMLWSRYCPSLKDTGFVSGATGFLDFLSYSAAALGNLSFSLAIKTIGWKWLILVWFALVLLGVLISLPYHKLQKKQKECK